MFTVAPQLGGWTVKIKAESTHSIVAILFGLGMFAFLTVAFVAANG